MQVIQPGRCILAAGLIAVILLMTLSTPVSAGAQPYHILILNSYNPGLFFSDGEIAGAEQAFQGEKAEFTVEYMDSKKITSPEYRDLLLKSYRMKYAKVRFDAIISLDDDAFQFLLNNTDTLFPGTPVFFCGVNNFNDAMIAGHPQFTGVVETLSRNETIDLAIRLHPGTERVLVVTDQTTSGEINHRIIEDIAATGRFLVPVEFLDLDRHGLSLQELKYSLARAPPKSVVYYSDFFQDKDKVTYLPGEVMEELSAVSAAPIYAHGDQYLGHGAVGGKMNSGLLQGETAGRMALRNLTGEPISGIPVYKEGMTAYLFDENQLRRWNVPVSALPPDSEVINHLESPLEKYGLYLAAIGVFIVLETWIIIALLISRRKRMQAEDELRSAEQTLSTLIDAPPESVILIRTDGTVVYSNAVAALRLGTTTEGMLNKDLFSLIPPDLASLKRPFIEQAVSTGHDVRHVDTRPGRTFDTTYSPIPMPDGTIGMIAILAIDITESQQLQDTLRRINRKLKNLSEITRVDLENRIFVIQGYIDLIKTDPPEQKRREYLEKLNQMLKALVGAIGLSRQYQDLGDKLPAWQDVNKSFLYAPSHVSLGLAHSELLPESLDIFADPQLEKALLSLLNRTLQNGNGVTVVRLASWVEEGTLVLLYEDDGPAVPEKEKAKLFNPDYPEYRTLFIAREILDVTGIGIRECGKGERGARFEIRVPPGLYRRHEPDPDTPM